MDRAIDAFRIVQYICVTGLVIGTLEYWAVAKTFSVTGAHSWRIQQLRPGMPRLAWISGAPGAVFDEIGVRSLLVMRLALLLLMLLVPTASWPFTFVLGLLVLNNLVFTWRRGLYGDDGSDQMNAILLITIFLCVGPHSTPTILAIGLWFLALQACLSYTAAGIAKLVSPIWRNGDAVFQIFNTASYGLKPVAAVLEHRRWLNLTLCWSVILIETLFPLCLILPEPWNWGFLAWGLTFHVLCGVIMGLNSFVWAFVATYPAIIHVSSQAREFLGAHGIW